jgi:hypothetical protein
MLAVFGEKKPCFQGCAHGVIFGVEITHLHRRTVKRAGFGKLEGFGVVNQLFRRLQMAFDLKQCERDGWKCEVADRSGYQWGTATYIGKSKNENYLLLEVRGSISEFHSCCIRNIPKPKVRRWLYGHETYSTALGKAVLVNVPLIEDSTGIRVDHSDAVIEALEGVNGKMPYFEGAAIVTSVILNAIAKIKKDRGE